MMLLLLPLLLLLLLFSIQFSSISTKIHSVYANWPERLNFTTVANTGLFIRVLKFYYLFALFGLIIL